MSSWEQTPVRHLERLFLLPGSGMPWYPRGARGGSKAEGGLAVFATLSWSGEMNGRMEFETPFTIATSQMRSLTKKVTVATDVKHT